jgi:uncharacterized protein YqkB
MFEVDWLNEPVTKFNVPSKYFALELITHVLFLRFLMFADELPDYEQDHPHPLIRGHLAASGISAWLRATASVKESKGFDDWLQSKLHAKVIWEMQYMFFGPQHLSKYYNDSNTEENIKQKIDLLIESLEKTLLLVKEFASSRDAK